MKRIVKKKNVKNITIEAWELFDGEVRLYRSNSRDAINIRKYRGNKLLRSLPLTDIKQEYIDEV